MNVYVVIGDNGDPLGDYYQWNEAVFSSRQSAEKYVSEAPVRYAKDMARIKELVDLSKTRELTSSEMFEINKIENRWWDDTFQNYSIEEYEVLD